MTSDALTRDLRLWPGVALAALLVLVRYVLVIFVPSTALFAAPVAGLVLGLLILLWWMFASRAPWSERWLVLGAIAVFATVTRFLLHESVAQSAGGMLYMIYVVPLIAVALVAWAALSRGWKDGPRRLALVAAVAAVCVPFTLLQSPGMLGTGQAEFGWRWSTAAEDRLVPGASRGASGAGAVGEMRWPGFRGPGRDSTLRGTNIATDWQASPPVELWRRPVGPGWSSFAVAGDVLYTQEQRGDSEVVSAYRVSTGEPVWEHSDEARFWEAMGGVGPRATPAVHGDRVYALGATGVLNALDAATGDLVWTRNLATDTGAAVPEWGFSGSPLVHVGADTGERVIVTASGAMAAYDAATGEPIWGDAGTTDGEAYVSPVVATLGGIEQLVLLSPLGAAGVALQNGLVIWQYERGGQPIVQPAITAAGELLIGATESMGGSGVIKLDIGHGPTGWAVEEAWESNRLKPYFNDYVVHEGHAYGFDGSIMAAIDLEQGRRAWKGGRYGHGQLLLLADQDLLLVLSEDGELVLVSATPERHEEIAKVPAIEGKTWNHPVLIDDVLLVRNAEEMAAFRLAADG